VKQRRSSWTRTADGSPACAPAAWWSRCASSPPPPKGTIFVTLEDETGSVNVIVWKPRARGASARRCCARGCWAVAGHLAEAQDGVTHLVARRLVDLSAWLGRLTTTSRDFR
jgi:error-prone DNA polymerase